MPPTTLDSMATISGCHAPTSFASRPTHVPTRRCTTWATTWRQRRSVCMVEAAVHSVSNVFCKHQGVRKVHCACACRHKESLCPYGLDLCIHNMQAQGEYKACIYVDARAHCLGLTQRKQAYMDLVSACMHMQAQGEHVARAATTMDPTPIRNNGAYGNNVADALGAGCPKFLVREALGPFKLDLGDILYAPNTLVDSGKVGGCGSAFTCVLLAPLTAHRSGLCVYVCGHCL
eukprot:1140357-Pelagomonas_calceolata.AAC.6